jgi:DNA-directed RNA polymerase subunit alpha
MLKYRNFGKKSLDEIKEKLEELNLSLGMPMSEEITAAIEVESKRIRSTDEEEN